MRKLLLLGLVALMLGAPLARAESLVDETRATLRSQLLRLINRDRERFGLRPVQLDPATSAIADAYCRDQIRNHTMGHFGLDGEAPYMRYSFAGGNDGISENAAAWSAPYSFSDRVLFEMMRSSEASMMSEAGPHDGHRRTILDPWATHVGIGLAWERGEFRIVEEFVRRYVDWTRPIPRSASNGDRVLVSGKPAAGYPVEAITVHRDPLPHAMSAVTANAIDSYSLPEAKREYLPRLKQWFRSVPGGGIEQTRNEYSDGRTGDFQVSEDGSFHFAVPLDDGPGVYTIVVWLRPPGAQLTIPASNISVRVDGSSRSGSSAAVGMR
jgi:Uncharacterized protein with SCP/PR1 domains